MLLAILAADEAPKEVVNPIIPEVSEMFWGGLSFAALFMLINFVLLPPVQRAMRDREATIQADKDAADAARAKAASAKADADDEVADVRAEASAVVDTAREEAEAERQRLLARAEREVAAMKEIAEEEIARDREDALLQLRPQVADLAVNAASRVVSRPIDANAARPVVDRVLNS